MPNLEIIDADSDGTATTATLFDPELAREYDVEVDFDEGTASVTAVRGDDATLELCRVDDTEKLRVSLWASRNLRAVHVRGVAWEREQRAIEAWL